MVSIFRRLFIDLLYPKLASSSRVVELIAAARQFNPDSNGIVKPKITRAGISSSRSPLSSPARGEERNSNSGT
jgi:hypothetical protein